MGGDLSVVFRPHNRNSAINTNFRGDDPFSALRVRTYLSKQLSPDLGVVAEFLWDSGADRPRVQGAYAAFSNLPGGLGAKVGVIGATFGNFAYRSTYFNQNPVIGVPLMWGYHTHLPGNGIVANDSLLLRRSTINRGVPAAYEACWNPGLELYGEFSLIRTAVEWAAGLTYGSLSTMAASNEGYQKVARLGLRHPNGLRWGWSGSLAPWIRPEPRYAYPDPVRSYHQYAVGPYLEYQAGKWKVFSEAIWTAWEMPLTYERDVSLTSGYVEARYSFSAGWYAGARVDALSYGKISRNSDGSGGKVKWGYDVNRLEMAVAWRVIREAMVRVDYQMNRFSPPNLPGDDIVALQLQCVF